jgi:hypothetical protein
VIGGSSIAKMHLEKKNLFDLTGKRRNLGQKKEEETFATNGPAAKSWSSFHFLRDSG